MFGSKNSTEKGSHYSSTGERREADIDRDEDLRETLEAYQSGLTDEIYRYVDGVDALSHNANMQEADYHALTSQVDQGVTVEMRRASNMIPGLLKDRSQLCIEDLSEGDKAIFAQAAATAITHGSTDNYFVETILNTASTPTARAAMEAALDDFRFAQAKAKSITLGSTDGYFVETILNTASTPTARAAMEAALDDFRFAEAKAKAQKFGRTDDYSVNSTLSTASTPTAQAAMEAALDDFRFAEAKSKAKTFGSTDNDHVQMILKTASSMTARRAMSNLITESFLKSHSEGSYTSSPKHGPFDYNTQNDNTRTRRQHTSSQRAQTPFARPDTFQQPPTKMEKAAKVKEEYASRKEYSWLAGVSTHEVLKVLNTAEALRKKAIDEGKESPSDAKIYRIYRQKAERLHDEPDHPIHTSVQILTALMDGDLKHGILPRL